MSCRFQTLSNGGVIKEQIKYIYEQREQERKNCSLFLFSLSLFLFFLLFFFLFFFIFLFFFFFLLAAIVYKCSYKLQLYTFEANAAIRCLLLTTVYGRQNVGADLSTSATLARRQTFCHFVTFPLKRESPFGLRPFPLTGNVVNLRNHRILFLDIVGEHPRVLPRAFNKKFIILSGLSA